MCRLYGFRSSLLSGVHASLVAAENALAHQSQLHPDGWGLAYYNNRFPQLIRNDQRALGDALFKELTGLVSTRTLLAHIRQATVGEVGILNCHPFQHGPWTFAHNGHIAGFLDDEEIRSRVLASIDPRFGQQLLGSTDSEALFYIFLSRLARRVEDIYHDGIRVAVALDALHETLLCVRDIALEYDEHAATCLSVLLTNGSTMIGFRFGRSLHYSTHKTRCPERDSCHAFVPGRCEAEVSDGIVNHLVVASERIADNPNVWIELGEGEHVSVDGGMNFRRGAFSGMGTPPTKP